MFDHITGCSETIGLCSRAQPGRAITQHAGRCECHGGLAPRVGAFFDLGAPRRQIDRTGDRARCDEVSMEYRRPKQDMLTRDARTGVLKIQEQRIARLPRERPPCRAASFVSGSQKSATRPRDIINPPVENVVHKRRRASSTKGFDAPRPRERLAMWCVEAKMSKETRRAAYGSLTCGAAAPSGWPHKQPCRDARVTRLTLDIATGLSPRPRWYRGRRGDQRVTLEERRSHGRAR